MKKIILILSLFISASFAGINWNSYQSAINMSSNHLLKKDIFVMIVSEHCRFCHKMLNELKKDPKVQMEINKKFYPVIINSSRDFTPINLDTGVSPSYFILDSKTLKIKNGPITGYMPPKILLRKLLSY